MKVFVLYTVDRVVMDQASGAILSPPSNNDSGSYAAKQAWIGNQEAAFRTPTIASKSGQDE